MNFSVVIITNSSRPSTLLASINSALTFADEVIVVGDVKVSVNSNKIKYINCEELAKNGKICKMRNIGASKSTCKWVINCDDDIVFSLKFFNKLNDFILNNPNIDTFTTKVIGTNGRYWDWTANKNGTSYMIDYDCTDPDLYYSGAFIIRKNIVAKSIPYDESLGFYEMEDVLYSKALKKAGYSINIDSNNYVIHADSRYTTYRHLNGTQACQKDVTDPEIITYIQEPKIKREIDATLRLYNI